MELHNIRVYTLNSVHLNLYKQANNIELLRTFRNYSCGRFKDKM